MFERTWWKPWTWFPVAAVEAVEAEWTVEDVDWLIASRDFEASIGGHGIPLAEAMSDEANPANPDGLFYFTADVNKPKVDWAERARSKAAQQFREMAGKDADMAGYVFPVRKVWRV